MMETIQVCAGDDSVNVERSPGVLTSVSRSINIASVRAASLRTCGLRAAARAASSRGRSFSPQTGFSPTVSQASSAHLSYTNSHEPGEDSQLNAFAMVDKLVDLNAGVMWQETPELNKAAEQSSVKGLQSVKGLRCLAQSADMKNRQGKLGIFDWVDSQSDDAEKVSSTISTQSKQCQHIADQKEQNQATMSDMVMVKDSSKTFLESRGGHLICQPALAESSKGTCANQGSTDFECHLSDSLQNNVVDNIVNNQLHDLDPHHERVEAEELDIGTNTQVALEAMDIMRHGDPSSSPFDKKEKFSALDIGNDTQTALDAMDILRYGIEPNLSSSKQEREEENEDSRCQKLGECNHVENVVQTKVFSVGISAGRKRGLKSRSSTGSKANGKKSLSRGSSNTSKKVEKSPLKALVPDFNSNKMFLLDFSSAMVPRRKRSRLCSPRVSFNENIEVFRWQKSEPCLCEPPPQEADKQDRAEGRKNILQLGKSTELAVLTESTNGRRTKRDSSTRSDCHILLEQSRKRRKCESKSIFVLFSHSLSETIIKQQKKMLKKLGGHVTTSAAKATHFVADSFVRSRNMLEIMAAGKAVVTTNWLEGCSQAQYFVDEESYILEDAQKEKEWGFCMHSSLVSSRRRPLLKGMKVVVSPNTVPDFAAMKAIIESAGGQVWQKLSICQQLKPDDIASISFVLASEVDSDFCAEYIRQGCRVYSTELILHGVVVQSLDLARNRLFAD